MSDKLTKATDMLEIVFHDLALDVAESRALTEIESAELGINLDTAIAELMSDARQAIAAMRRAQLSQARHERLASAHDSNIKKFLHLSKEAIVERLRQLQLQNPGRLQVEYRDLKERSEEDLRSLLADLEDLLSHGS